MYSFGPLPKQAKSGRMVGTHQKIDRVARRHLAVVAGFSGEFPAIHEILHFEGSRGPDAIKFKSPGVDEPLHFIDPKHPEGQLLAEIRNHQNNLQRALKARDTTRASFEAAWLAHAVTDGLTPAHHEPYEDQIKEIGHRGEQTTRVRDKFIVSGGSRAEIVRNNWKHWGAKGILTTHTLFEAGIASAVKPYRFDSAMPGAEELEAVQRDGFEQVYVRLVREVASLDMYESFKKTGWTNKLAQQTNKELMPRIIMAVTLAWYDSLLDHKETHAH